MKIFRPANLFTCLAVLLTFAFIFRLANLAALRSLPEESGMTRPAQAADMAPASSNEEPPPLTQADVDKAVKETAARSEEENAPEPVKSGAKKEEDMPAPPPEAPSFSASEIEVLQSLSKRRDDLDRREKLLVQREALLDAAGQEVDHKIAELNKLKGEIENLLGQQQKMEDERITSLVKIYEGMKPKEAATIFNTLDMDVLLPVIGRMSERKVAPVLASMDPEKARLVTIRLAQQRELPLAGAAKKALSGPPGPAP
ncbi:MAG: MotE family protein [Alphaproteobacteria bacterium]